MSTTTTTTPPASPTRSPAPAPGRAGPGRGVDDAARPIPFRRLLSVELRKMFDTRSGFWLLVGIVLAASLATAAVVAWAPDQALTYASFGAAVGVPMAVLLPVVAILSVTSEWSQRTGLATFTLVPHRGRVVAAKGLGAVIVGVVSMLIAFAVGAVGNLAGSALAGVDTVWDMTVTDLLLIVLGNVLGLLVGFMLGLLMRSSAAAVVGYFVYSFVLTSLFTLLAALQPWFADLQPWVDFSFAQAPLFEGPVSAREWAHLGVTSVVWLVTPLTVGLLMLRRAEVR